MKRTQRALLIASAIIVAAYLAAYPVRHAVVRHQVREIISSARFSKIENLGSTQKLVILPLFENAVSQDDLIADTGVSYLVTTDRARILFDLGFDPDIMQHNLDKLGISIKDIDMIVISHDHPDHVGGHLWWPEHTFSLGKTQANLGDMPVYVPEHMTYPNLTPIVAEKPQTIAEGVASLGTIPYEEMYKPSIRQYIRGEQALAVNVDGIGVVLISGCGHPGIKNMLERAEMLFDFPVTGIVGGLHYTNRKEGALQSEIQLLQAQPLRLLAISPHDSSPATIQIFRDAFPGIYQDIAVGREITIK